MNWPSLFDRPRLLALMALAFAFVPAWLALVTYRDGRHKDERLFDASAQILAGQLRNSTDRGDYFIGMLRSQARDLPDAALTEQRMTPQSFDWKEKFPHVRAFGYAEQSEDGLVVRWTSSEKDSAVRVGDNLAKDGRVTSALELAHKKNRGAHVGILQDQHRLMLMSEVLTTGTATTTRGFVLGWLDLDAICRDATIPQIRDQILMATPLAGQDAPPKGIRPVSITSDAEWIAGISRGANFNQAYGAPTPWLAFVAAGFSAVPLLLLAILAGRASRLKTELAAEREVVAQQRFFSQSVSHEFRTPLGIILSGTELLETYEGRLSPERRSEVLAEIKDSTEQMNEMLERVLLLGRIEAGRLQCDPKLVNVGELCRELATKSERVAHDRCTVTVDAPETDAMLDSKLISSILGNLLSNAIKYTAPGGLVTLHARTEPGRIVFEVRDEGIGIPKQDLQRIMDPFQRGANAGDVPGSGLGLAIAQRCTALHGGTLKIESETGRGTVATLTLPV